MLSIEVSLQKAMALIGKVATTLHKWWMDVQAKGGFPFRPPRMFGTDIKKMGLWSIVLSQDFPQSHPASKTGFSFAWQEELGCNLLGTRDDIGCGFCGRCGDNDAEQVHWTCRVCGSSHFRGELCVSLHAHRSYTYDVCGANLKFHNQGGQLFRDSFYSDWDMDR